jgi:hypothetical protein
MSVVPAAKPSEWGDYQRAFRDRFVEGDATAPSVAVHWRYHPPVDAPQLGVIGLMVAAASAVWRVVRAKTVNLESLVAVWRVDAPSGTPATLAFECEAAPLEIEGDGQLIGEFALNGALCIQTSRGELIWPVYNPRPPALPGTRR